MIVPYNQYRFIVEDAKCPLRMNVTFSFYEYIKYLVMFGVVKEGRDFGAILDSYNEFSGCYLQSDSLSVSYVYFLEDIISYVEYAKDVEGFDFDIETDTLRISCDLSSCNSVESKLNYLRGEYNGNQNTRRYGDSSGEPNSSIRTCFC